MEISPSLKTAQAAPAPEPRENAETTSLVIKGKNQDEDVLQLYIDGYDYPMWRWSGAGHAYVRTSLAITGSHTLNNVGGYSNMLGIRSDLGAGVPAVVIQTNEYAKFRGPLILGLDYDTTPTFVVEPEGKIGGRTREPKAELHLVGQNNPKSPTVLLEDGFIQTSREYPAKARAATALYSVPEGPEVALYVRGTARVTNGKATIHLPEHFAAQVESEGVTVQLTPTGQWLELYTTDKTPQKITVWEAGGRTGSFDYRVYGVRKGFGNYAAQK